MSQPQSARLSTREKLILSGLYLSKFDQAGLRALGFDSFVEAFNVVGFALGSRPASVKNYRDEFDPLFPNGRKGWHRRRTRDYCLVVFHEYSELDFESFTDLVRSFLGYNGSVVSLPDPAGDVASSFAQRLITGLAAERYFEAVQASLPEFGGYSLENTTLLGCGYDYRFRADPRDESFLAVEVKGLRDQVGSVSMTPKEHAVAAALRDRFYLFVVRNFRESPYHTIFQNPVGGPLQFRKVERMIVQTSWLTNL